MDVGFIVIVKVAIVVLNVLMHNDVKVFKQSVPDHHVEVIPG